MSSIMAAQRAMILDTIKHTAPGEWKVMVMDEGARRLVDNVVKEDDILNANITHIEQMEQRRQMNPDTDVVYLLSPLPHIVDCLVADFERRRYRKAYILWTSKLPPQLRERVDRARGQIARLQVMNIDYYPRQSHLITFRDPWSFPILYHNACNNLIRQHLSDLAEKIVALCVTLGEYPHIRYWRPPNPLPSHEAHVLCSLLARQVQDELDMWAQYHQDFPPPSPRPRGVLYITDRSLDLIAPSIHEFTYEAMAFDLLPIKDGEKITYRTVVNEGQPDQEEKDMELSDNDRLWVENRHRHMKDTIDKLMTDFQKFIAENPHFANKNPKNANSLNTIKDMMAGLPQFQTMKEAYSLHLSMAQECMNIFERCKLLELSSVEQTLATGFDDDWRKASRVADLLVRTLDDDEIIATDRARLLAQYLISRNGLLSSDLTRLRLHAQLSEGDEQAIRNLEYLGARVNKPLKDKIEKPPPIFALKTQVPGSQAAQEYSLHRYETVLKGMLEAHCANTLDQNIFPYTKPHLEASQPDAASQVSAASLRSAKPTWAKTRGGGVNRESQQRVIVFMAGGATYSESRSCYEVGEKASKDVFLVTSHMLTPGLWTRQLADLSADRRRLGLPTDAPKPRPPNWVFEPEPEHRQPAHAAGGAMEAAAHASPAASAANRRAGLVHGGGGGGLPSRVGAATQSHTPPPIPPPPAQMPVNEMGRINLNGDGKLHKDKDKKKHKLFGHSKK